jgi:hypothetical protein
MILNVLINIVMTDYKAGANIVSKEQANYNSEIGICDSFKRYSYLSYSGFRIAIYYLNYENQNISFSLASPVSDDYVKIKVSYINANGLREYTLDSIGYFYGCEKETLKKFSN